MIVRKMVNIELENRNLQSHGPNDSLPPKVLQPSTKHHSLGIKYVLKGDISSSSHRILFCALNAYLSSVCEAMIKHPHKTTGREDGVVLLYYSRFHSSSAPCIGHCFTFPGLCHLGISPEAQDVSQSFTLSSQKLSALASTLPHISYSPIISLKIGLETSLIT